MSREFTGVIEKRVLGRKRFKYGAVEPKAVASKVTGAQVRSSRSKVYVPVNAV